MNDQTLITIIGALIPSLAGIAGYWFSRRKSAAEVHKVEAEATETIERTAAKLIETLNRRIAELEAEIHELRLVQQARNAEMDTMRKEISSLRVKLERANQRIQLLENENAELNQKLRAARGAQ